MATYREQKRAGFTLVELVVVSIVLGTFLLVPVRAVQRARDAAAKTQTANRLKELALSLHSCHDAYKRFPPAWGPFPPPPAGQQANGTSGTIHYWLLPFLEADNVYKQALPAFAGPGAKVWDLPKVYSQVVGMYVSLMDPSTTDETVRLTGDTPWGVGNYAANTRAFGGLKKNATAQAWDNKAGFATITDGASNTIAFATRYAVCGEPPGGSAWAGGNTSASLDNFLKSGAFFGSDIEDIPVGGDYATTPPFQVEPDVKGGKNPCNPLFAQAYTRDSIQVGMFDGAVHTASARISARTWGRLLHPSDGNILDTDW